MDEHFGGQELVDQDDEEEEDTATESGNDTDEDTATESEGEDVNEPPNHLDGGEEHGRAAGFELDGPPQKKLRTEAAWPSKPWYTVLSDGRWQCMLPDKNTGKPCGKICDPSPSRQFANHKHKNHGKDHPCDECDKVFKTREALRKHKLSHSDARLHVCVQCNTSFKLKTKLNAHVKKQHPNEPVPEFKCPFAGCDRTYKFKDSLDEHIAIHEGKRYPCPAGLCGKQFTDKGAAKRHAESVHGDKLQRPCKNTSGPDGVCPLLLNGAPKYDGYCVRCFRVCFPTDERTTASRRYIHVKEGLVCDFLKERFPDQEWSFNVRFGNTRFRPDAYTVLGEHRDYVIIVEIDEWSHELYNCGKEREREKMLKDSAPPGSVVFVVRFNPDRYTMANGSKVPSCFRKTPKTQQVSIANPKAWEARLAKLQETVKEILDNRDVPTDVPKSVLPEDEHGRRIVVIELFYDQVAGKKGGAGAGGMANADDEDEDETDSDEPSSHDDSDDEWVA